VEVVVEDHPLGEVENHLEEVVEGRLLVEVVVHHPLEEVVVELLPYCFLKEVVELFLLNYLIAMFLYLLLLLLVVLLLGMN